MAAMTPASNRGRTLYSTIVADPPWHYDGFGVGRVPEGQDNDGRKTPLPYMTLSVSEIEALPVSDLAAENAHLYLWTTNRYLRDAFQVLDSWGFRYAQTLIWCKTPMGKGPGGAFAQNAEYVIFGRRDSLAHLEKQESVWFNWPRTAIHSKKPEAFMDLVERVSPAPRLELFARRQRLGWDTWGNEALEHVEVLA